MSKYKTLANVEVAAVVASSYHPGSSSFFPHGNFFLCIDMAELMMLKMIRGA